MKNTLSINIEQKIDKNFNYIVTPNAEQVVSNIVSSFQSGTHSFTLVGTYGTGKSSFIMALERDLQRESDCSLIQNTGQFNNFKKFEFLNIVGDYATLSKVIGDKIGYDSFSDSKSFFKEFEKYYQSIQKQDKFLLVVLDEFGKILEHAAKNNPEKELYFIQQFAEYVNDSSKNIIFLTTLHQNFGAYSRKLTEEQRNEWTKVKGRFQEVVFIEPVEQLLYVATEQMTIFPKKITNETSLKTIFDIAQKTKFINDTLTFDTAKKLYPMDVFSAKILTLAIQNYGQNERSLFSFLNSKGSFSLENANVSPTKTYNLVDTYNYIWYNFHLYLFEANADTINWRAMRVALEKVEGLLDDEIINDATKLVKTIGLINLFGVVSFDRDFICQYAKSALDIDEPKNILKILETNKIIRFANYRNQYILFDGTDINIEDELLNANKNISLPRANKDNITPYFENRVVPAISYYYRTGTPRYFEYSITNEAINPTPKDDIDGIINLIFPILNYNIDDVLKLSEQSNFTIYVYFNNTQEIIKHLHEIEKLKYVREHRLSDNTDKIAIREVENMLAYEKALLNKAINESLTTYSDNVVWAYKGKIEQIRNLSDFNKLLSRVCDVAYPNTPIMRNELFNKQKISSSISTARVGYLKALLVNFDKEDLGFENDKFPPEKTIYYSLLKNTGIHRDNGNDYYTLGEPTTDDLRFLWNVCEEFLQSSIEKKRNLSELVKILQSAPIKLKQGFIDFWLPTYLFIKRQDISIFNSRDVYVLEINREFLEILQKNPSEFSVKKFSVDGIKLDFFNQYRKFINLQDEEFITTEPFIETIKPFFAFYKRLNDYAKQTRKFDSPKTAKFRDVLANAKDPEKTFFEDLPQILGFKELDGKNKEFLLQYQDLISNAVKDLRLCYDNLIGRIEKKIVSDLGLNSKDFQAYVTEIQSRYQHIKQHLLTQKQQTFLNRILSPADNKKNWYQSICFVVLDKPLDNLRDDEEEFLIENLIFLFREIEKYTEISKIVDKNSDDEVFKFEMVSTKGTISPQAYRLSDKQKEKSENIENKINKILSGDTNLDICTLLKILNDKLKQE